MVMSQIFEEFQFCAKHKNYILSKTDILHNKYVNQNKLKIVVNFIK